MFLPTLSFAAKELSQLDDEKRTFLAKPILPSEYQCFLCQDALKDPIIVQCERSNKEKNGLKACIAPSVCRSCCLDWNDSYRKVLVKASTTDAEPIITNKIKTESNVVADLKLDRADSEISGVDGSPILEASTGCIENEEDNSDQILYCPACGNKVIKLIPNVAANNVLNALQISAYRTIDFVSAETQADNETDLQNSNNQVNKFQRSPGVDNTGINEESGPKVPYYLTVPDAMRAAEYSMTARDISLVTALQRDGACMILLNSAEQMRIVKTTGYIPLRSSKIFSERLARKLTVDKLKTSDNLKELFDSLGGHPSCPFLLPGVGEKLGGSLLSFFTSRWRRIRKRNRKPDSSTSVDSDVDHLGQRGYHLILTLVSSTKTSISLGGIARVTAIELGFEDLNGYEANVPASASMVPSDVIRQFQLENMKRVTKTLSYDNNSNGREDGIEVERANHYVTWFMKVQFVETWNPSIMFPYKSQPFHSIISNSLSSITSKTRTHPAYSPVIAEIGGNTLMPAIVAKIRASEASTAGLNRNELPKASSRASPETYSKVSSVKDTIEIITSPIASSSDTLISIDKIGYSSYTMEQQTGDKETNIITRKHPPYNFPNMQQITSSDSTINHHNNANYNNNISGKWVKATGPVHAAGPYGAVGEDNNKIMSSSVGIRNDVTDVKESSQSVIQFENIYDHSSIPPDDINSTENSNKKSTNKQISSSNVDCSKTLNDKSIVNITESKDDKNKDNTVNDDVIQYPIEPLIQEDYPNQPYGAQIAAECPPLSRNEFKVLRELQKSLNSLLDF